MIIKYLKAFFAAAICLLFFSTPAQAQADTTQADTTKISSEEISEAEREAVLQYFNSFKTLQDAMSVDLYNLNSLQFQPQLAEAERTKRQTSYLANIEKHIDKATKMTVPAGCTALHKLMLDYWKQKTAVLNKIARKEYLSKAEEELQCKRCLAALEQSYALQVAESPNDRKLAEAYDKEAERVGEKYQFLLVSPKEGREAVYELHEAQDYLVSLALIVGHLTESYNGVVVILNKIRQKQATTAELHTAIAEMQRDCRQAQQSLKKAGKRELSCWEAANLAVNELSKIAFDYLPKIEQILLKPQRTEADAKAMNKELEACALASKSVEGFLNAKTKTLQSKLEATKKSKQK